MATADQLKALARNVARGDDQGARDVLLQVAARANSQGKARLSEEINAILAKWPAGAKQRFQTVTAQKFYGGGPLAPEAEGLLRAIEPRQM